VRAAAQGCWLGIARFVNTPWKGAIVLVVWVAVAVPIIVQIFRLKPSVEFSLLLPYNSGSFKCLESIADNFGGAGVVFPYRLLFVNRDPSTTVVDPEGFTYMTEVRTVAGSDKESRMGLGMIIER
jgi:hypothetical protein